MAKRFITTDLFSDAWFMDLPNKYKLFWIFLITDCNHAGIWEVNYKRAIFYVGEHLEPVECERLLKERIINIENNKYWFIPKFIEFQYGLELKKNNPATKSVINLLEKHNLLGFLTKITVIEGANKELTRSFIAPKDKDKVKDKEEDKEKDTEEPKKLTEIKAYFTAKDYPLEEAISFFNHYEAQGWVTGSGVPIFNWKMKAENWHKEQRSRNLNKKTEQKSEITYSEILDIVDKTPKTEKSKVWDKYENIGKDKYRLKTTA